MKARDFDEMPEVIRLAFFNDSLVHAVICETQDFTEILERLCCELILRHQAEAIERAMRGTQIYRL